MPLLSESLKQKNEIQSIRLMRFSLSKDTQAWNANSSANRRLQHRRSTNTSKEEQHNFLPSSQENRKKSPSWIAKFFTRILLYLTAFLGHHWRVRFGLLKDCKTSVDRAQVVLVHDYQGKYHLLRLKTIRIARPDTGAGSDEDDLMAAENQNAPNSTHRHTDSPTASQLERDTNRNYNRTTEWKLFQFREERFLWNPTMNMFEIASMDSMDVLHATTTRNLTGLDPVLHRERLIEFGPNMITFKKTKKWKKRFRELKKSIYVVPLLCVMVWIFKSDWMVTFLTLFLTMFALIINMRDFAPSNSIVKSLAKAYGNEVRVIRSGESFITGSASLVPGDLIEIHGRMTLPCDAVLLQGAVEVDEQQISGDPTPLSKHAASSKRFDVLQSNLLIGGSYVNKLKPPPNGSVVAVVVKTGFHTVKGGLIKQILTAQRTALSHPYISDVYLLLRMMLVCGFVSFAVAALYTFINWNRVLRRGFFFDNILDTLIVCYPPFMGIIYTIPLMAVKRRLKKKRIYIQNLYSIMKFGIVDVVCFDKTNTLTENKYKLKGILQVKNGHFVRPPVSSIYEMNLETLYVLAACNSLALVDGKILGDSLEMELFEQSGFKMRNRPSGAMGGGYTLARSAPNIALRVEQVFPFNSKARKNGVLIVAPRGATVEKNQDATKHLSSEREPQEMETLYLVKGAPEAVRSMCKDETVPSDLDKVLEEFGMLGNRILAFAMKRVKVTPSERESASSEQPIKKVGLRSLETDMEFLGLLFLQNSVVQVHSEVSQLEQANIHSCIMTGDSIYTAVACAKESTILNQNSYIRHGITKAISSFETIVDWEALSSGGSRTSARPSYTVDESDTNITMSGECLSLLRNGRDTAKKRYLYNHLIRRCKIFSEVLPVQKGELVKDLRRQGYAVSFVGDNLNDVFAFSLADVGLAVNSDRGAYSSSTFAAQFSCEQENGVPISYLIRQSRCLLENMSRAAKFSCIFFFIQVLILIQNNNCTFFNNPRIAWQVFQGFLLTLTLATNKPLKKLKKFKPARRILTKGFFFSVLLHVFVHVLALTTVLEVLRHTELYTLAKGQSVEHSFRFLSWWYEKRPPYIELEGQIIFLYSNFQLISSAVAIHFSAMHSHPLKNLWFFVLVTILVLFNYWIVFPFPQHDEGFLGVLNLIYTPFAKIFAMGKGFDLKHGAMEAYFLVFRFGTIPFFMVLLFIVQIIELLLRYF